MEVKLKSEYNSSTNPLHFVLRNRDISEEDFDKIVNPTKELMPDWTKLDNIYEGMELLKKHVDKGSNIYVLNDDDNDGIASTSVMYQYLKTYLQHDNSNILIHKKRKSHGIKIDEVEDLSEGDLLITPDAASSDFEQHQELHNRGIDVLVIDHHLAPKKDTPAVIINNQLSDNFPNKQLTGSAMTYLFCRAYSETYNIELPTSLLDMSAVGMVADRANFANDLGAYYLMRKGLEKYSLQNPMLKMFATKDKSLAGRDWTAKDVGFSIAPNINAVFRVGTDEELEQVVHAMCNFDYTVFNKRKKQDVHITEEGVLRAKSVRNRQKKTEEKVLEQIHERIREKGSNDYKVLLVNSTGIIEDAGINGLVAIKLANQYKKPTLVMKVTEDKLRGSGRNFNNSPIESFNDLLSEFGVQCEGHDNAFGVTMDIDVAMNIQEKLEERLKDVDLNNSKYEVDFEWYGHVDSDVIVELGNHSNLWCNGIDEPLIHIKEYIINKSDIRFMGKTGRSIKIEVDGVDAVKFNMSEMEIHELTSIDSDTISLNLVCTATINTFNGMDKPQMIIQDFTVKKAEEVELDVHKADLKSLPF